MNLEGGGAYQFESGVSVEVRSSEYRPQKNERAEQNESEAGRAVILMGGWGNTRLASMNELSQAFADSSGANTYLVSTRSLEQGNKIAGETPDFLFEEARAVSKFILERGLKKVTITGQSQGADRAMNVVQILQDNPDISVDGLVLLGPMGLYEQEAWSLTKNFIKHFGVEVPKAVKASRGADASFIHGLAKNSETRASPDEPTAKEIEKDATRDGVVTHLDALKASWKNPAALVRRTASEVQEMAHRNQSAAELHVPIVLITGTDDTIAERERIVPEDEETKLRKELGESGERDKTLAAREKYLRENIFPQSPYVRMVVPEKMGNHLVQIYRPQAVAKVSTFLLDRYWRKQKNTEAA